MRTSWKSFVCVACLLTAGAASLRADETLRKAQQSLRDQGFYYGTIDGSPGDETTQAVRRYQIRNGLSVTGQLDAATLQSIAKTGTSAAPAPRSPQSDPKLDEDRRYANRPAAQAPPARVAPAPPTINGDDEEADDDEAAPAPPPPGSARPDLRVAPGDRRIAPNGVRPSASLTELLEGTLYEFAPPPVQSDIVRRAQINLLRSGFYGGDPDGRPGNVTTDALAEFQSANGLRRNGRLDGPTMAALRLMPGRRPGPPPRAPVFEGRIVR